MPKTLSSLVAIVTDWLTLKRRLSEETFRHSGFKLSKAAISSKHFKLDPLLPFVNQLPPQKKNFSTELMSCETPITKNATVRAGNFVTKLAKISDDQISANFSRRFRCRRLFGYSVTSASLALSLTSDLIRVGLK